nr:hypothetical protein [Tanacetum cinerariifolium]
FPLLVKKVPLLKKRDATAERIALLMKTGLGGDVFDLTDDEDPTDEDGDTGMDDSTGVLASLGGEIFLGRKKYQESNSDNTRGITVGEAIGACSGGICNSLVASYACMTSIYGSSCKGEKTSVAKRYLVKLFEDSGELGGDVFDLTGDEDPTDEDGDTGMDDSTGVLASLGGEIFLGRKKYQESNSDNTRGITVGEAIGACSGGIGEKTSVAKRYLVKLFEDSGEVFPGEAGK